MKKIIAMLVFCLLGVLLYAQERVAVLPFTGGEEREGDAIARFLGTELTKLGGVGIVPRTEVINRILEENLFQRNGLTDGDTIVALGKGANADYVVSGHIQTLGSKKIVVASIVNVKTYQQISGDYYEYDDLAEVAEYLPTLAKKLISNIKKDYSRVPTLVILPFDGADENNADILAQLLAIELANSGQYVVVTRTITVENIMKEQNIQRSGLTNKNAIEEIRIATNAQYVLAGSVSSLGNAGFMNVEIIGTRTQVQEKGAYIQYETIEDGARLIPVLSYNLIGVKKEYRIGDTGPGGGLIFYTAGSIYYECSDNLGQADWNDAKDLAKSYRAGGYDDWYLPNKEEVNYIYENLRVKSFILDDNWLWSSSEYNIYRAWKQRFNGGYQQYDTKTDLNDVRAVRAF